MLIEIIKSKIHRVKVTDADLNYVGSITIDLDLINAANLLVGEKVQVVNVNNCLLYTSPSPRDSV